MSEHSGPVEVVSVADRSCPECAAGKHRNCDGGSWDTVADGPAACPCWVASHGTTPVRLDPRTEAEVQADLAAERYEASLDRRWES